MYKANIPKENYNVSIDGYSMIMEEVTPNEAFNRRETIRHDIIAGTQDVMRGKYIVRNYTFITHLLINPEYPDIYDDIFRLWESKPCEVISKKFGGKFNAEVIIKRHNNDSPNYLTVEIQVIEIPENSLIPGEGFVTPQDKITPIKITSKKNKKDNKKDSKTKKNQQKKNTKKGKDNKKKGNNITRARK